jgi:polyribonucleotide nucleotidyltransferase
MDADAHRHMNGGNDDMRQRLRKSFYLHYEFPPYSVNETGRIGMPNRRMIGHGALAEKALERMMPRGHSRAYADMLSGKAVKGMLTLGELVAKFDAKKTGANAASAGDDAAASDTDDATFFPYSIRVTSEVSASDGSSSMATVCGATAALLDAGVPLRAPVAGVSVGLATPAEGTNWTADEKYQLLTDILGTEDHFGDMDFKIAGTNAGVTALQLDMKQRGIPIDILAEAMDRANEARGGILSSMHEKMAAQADDLRSATLVRPHVNQRVVFPLEDDGMVRMLVGPKGITIRALKSRYPNAHVNVISNPNMKGHGASRINPLAAGGHPDEPEPAAALVEVSGTSAQSLEECVRAIYAMFAPPTEGQVYMGVVSRVEKYGAFVELPDMSVVLVHKNELEPSSEEMGLDGVVRGTIDANLITGVGEPMELVCMGWDSEHGRVRYIPVRVAAELEAQKQREKEKATTEAKENFGWTASAKGDDEGGVEPEVVVVASENSNNNDERKTNRKNSRRGGGDATRTSTASAAEEKESAQITTGAPMDSGEGDIGGGGGGGGDGGGSVNRKAELGQTYLGQVKQVKSYGIWVDIGCNRDGMLHMSDLADGVTLQSFKPGKPVAVVCTKILDGSLVYLKPMPAPGDENPKPINRRKQKAPAQRPAAASQAPPKRGKTSRVRRRLRRDEAGKANSEARKAKFKPNFVQNANSKPNSRRRGRKNERDGESKGSRKKSLPKRSRNEPFDGKTVRAKYRQKSLNERDKNNERSKAPASAESKNHAKNGKKEDSGGLVGRVKSIFGYI